MPKLQIWFDQQEHFFQGKTHQEVLDQVEKALQALSEEQLDCTQLDSGYKEHQTIVKDPDTQKWNVEDNCNGGGEIEAFDTPREAIQEFLGYLTRNGDHWLDDEEEPELELEKYNPAKDVKSPQELQELKHHLIDQFRQGKTPTEIEEEADTYPFTRQELLELLLPILN